MPRIVAKIPATIRGRLLRSESTRLQIPAAIATVAMIVEWCVALGLGGRAERASVTGMRATARPGHHAAAVAPRTATKTIATSSVQGRLSGSMRWPTAGSSVGTSASQIARPTIAPISAPSAPTTVPLGSSTSRRCFSVAPIAASAPSWRSRRCAMTAKPAAATSVASSRKTVATENIASVSTNRSSSRASDPTRADRSPCDSMKASTAPAPAPVSARTVTWSGAPADEGVTRANSSLRSRGFSTMPTTVRRRPSSASGSLSSSPSSVATLSVTATWPGPSG